MTSGIPTQNLEPGTLLSARYRIESVLGRGGMGAVYLAKLEALGNKPVAIKEMRIMGVDEATQQQAVKQFQQEASFLAHLDHPNLVQVSDYFSEEGRHYLVMAYVKGNTLGELLAQRREPFPVLTVLEWALQLTSVLHFLHTQNPPIMFRDLKPSNIMLDDSNKIRLIDFGIARSYNPESVTATFLQGTGSSGYSPMEQYQGGGTTDPRSDIYSLGATLYHLLTNQIPISPVEVVSDGKTMTSPRSLNHNVTPALDQVLLKMLSLRKNDRQSDVAQVGNQLRSIYVALQQNSQATEALSGVIAALASQASQVQQNAPMVAPTQQTRVVQVTAPLPTKDPHEKYIWMVLASLCLVLMAFAGWMFKRLPDFQTAATSSPTAQVSSSPSPAVVIVERLPHSGEALAVAGHREKPALTQAPPTGPKPNSAAQTHGTPKPVVAHTQPQPSPPAPQVQAPSLPDPDYPQAPTGAAVPTRRPAAKPKADPTPVPPTAIEPTPIPKPAEPPVAVKSTPAPGPYNPYANLKDWTDKDKGFPPPLMHGFGPPVPDGKGGWMPDPNWKPGREGPLEGMQPGSGPFSRSGPGNGGPRSGGGGPR